MERNNSFPLKSFLEQWLPRLVALGILAYLVYSLLFKQDHFTWLHIIALAMAIGLILAPMASRLRVSNLIDFKSKLDGLEQEQRETKAQLNELTNQISTTISMRVNPVQVISLQGYQQLISNIQESESRLPNTTTANEGRKYTKVEFLRLVNGYRNRAFPLLLLTRAFQKTINEHRYPPSDSATEDMTMDEHIKYLVNTILENDLRTAFPIEVIDEKSGKTRPFPIITPDVIEGLRQINSLLDLSQSIETGKQELPSPSDIDNLFDKVSNALSTIGAGLEIVATNSILYRYAVTSAIKSLEEKIK
jgi:uncharacterized membrane-anchored protein YhcB (DUF1043 family)